MSPTEWERLNAKQKAANPNLGAKQKMLSTVAQYAETQIYGDGRDEVRTMQQDELQAARSSQGREPSEQRSIELADFVRLLPSSHALAQLHGHRATAEALSVVLSTDGAQRLLQHPPDEIETVWRSLSKETQDGFRLAVEQGGFIRTVEHPLAHGVPARVGRLRGYGNAIKPQVAQVFIEAYMSVESQHD